MRIATLILGLLLGALLFAQSWIVWQEGLGSSDQAWRQGGAVGLFTAACFIVGAAFALGYPIVSVIFFLIGALLAGVGILVTPFIDLRIWGALTVCLAVMACFAQWEKRKAMRVKADPHATVM